MTNSKRKELANTDFEAWAKESFEIATKIAYRNGGRIEIPRGGNMECTMVAAAPVLPVGYVVNEAESLLEITNSIHMPGMKHSGAVVRKLVA